MSEETLRQSLEAAVEAEEAKTESPPEQKEEVKPEPPKQEEVEVKPTPTQVEEPKQEEPKEEPKQETKNIVDVAPKSWKPALASKWATLDPEVKAEINRRDREVTKAFGENNQVREFHKQFQDLIRPHEARIAQFGSHPLEVVRQLLLADAILASGNPVKKAQFMATLIKDYGIDIRELDSALVGEAPADPMQATLERMLNEKLSPLQQFVNQQQQLNNQRTARIQQEAGATIEEMSTNVNEYPHFDEVREDMADIIEMNARRNIYLTPQQAYDRAVLMNPDWAAEQAQVRVQESQRQQALQQNDRAQKALNASSSVKGNASSAPINTQTGDSLRSAIEAAWTQLEGR